MADRREISGWGRWPRVLCAIATPSDPQEAACRIPAMDRVIARGLARSYGDSTLNPTGVISTSRLDRMISFDPETGVLVAEAGVTLGAIIAAFLRRGFFLPVTPGTKFVTLGGAVASDVHGKNHHHDGSFGDHVAWLDIADGEGRVHRCSPHENPDLFNLTFGAMGLTGIVLRVALRLRPVASAWILQRTLVAPGLDAAIDLFEAHHDASYSVAWIDCMARGAELGRSLIYLGAHAGVEVLDAERARAPLASPPRRARRVPFDAPGFALNRFSVGLFNRLYYARGRGVEAERLIDWDSYFYPLDSLLEWNRIYGRRGFAQYQCALPLAGARDGLAALLGAIAEAGCGSFLSVLKRFGPGAPQRPLSFPLEGYTLALDFPLSATALRLMDRLDAITRAAGGRLYLAKDSRMSAETFRAGYGYVLKSFMSRRAALAGAERFASCQSQRLGL